MPDLANPSGHGYQNLPTTPLPWDSDPIGSSYPIVEPLTTENPVQEFFDYADSLPSERLVARGSIDVIHLGKRYRAVWNQIWYRDIRESDHEFYVALLIETIGRDWLKEQQLLKSEDQHVIARWINEFVSLRPVDFGDKELVETEATGGASELLILARDLYDLQHIGQLPARILSRLKNRNEFQGARYEVAIAGSFARAGFHIEWVLEKSDKHFEFLATMQTTGERIAVEAKSRRWSGALHEPKRDTNDADFESAIHRLLKQACEQAPDGLPFIVCIETNLPPDHPSVQSYEAYFGCLRPVFDRESAPSQEDPDMFTAVIVTNSPWHYLEKETGGKGRNFFVFPRYSRYPLRSGKTLALIRKAINEYPFVPNSHPTPEELAALKNADQRAS